MNLTRTATRLNLPSRGRAATSQEACLVVIHSPDRTRLGTQYAVGGEEVTLGRDPENTVLLEEDDVSRRHARIFRQGDHHWIADLHSTNGTLVNDLPVAEHELASGDRIQLGSTIFKYLSGGDIEALYHEEVRRIALLDDLTGAHNKRFLIEFLEREIARCRRHDRPLSLAFLDVDHFKKVNDVHGHLAGDAVLREIAALVKPLVRKEGCFARYGGEEFALVLPETPLAKALVLAEKIRSRVEQAQIRFEEKTIPVTVSLGVAEMDGSITDPASFLGRADARLYEAKRSGRNRVAS